MSREVRRVPPDWEHPKNKKGEHIPLLPRFPYNANEIEEGLRDGWLKPDEPNHGIECMPDWPEVQRTHYQMYESVSEGTPISPVCESPEALARWLVEHNASACGDQTASYEGWLRVAQGGYAPTGILMGGRFTNGVDGL